jgi:hypothetical protein
VIKNSGNKEVNIVAEQDSNEQPVLNREEAEGILTWMNHIRQVLVQQFEGFQVDGQIGQHPVYGTLFSFTLSEQEKLYSCGFMLNELVHHFQHKSHPAMWLSSFFVDLIQTGESKPLPKPPQNDEEVGKIVDEYIMPHCTESVRSEFPEETMYVDLDMHPEQGPVVESGFPSIQEGMNTCAMPIQYLLTLYLLNRDPAEPLIQALYEIKDRQGQVTT